MGFGYAIMKGQTGMEGIIRETAGKRTVQARGLPAGETCALYALTGDGAENCAEAAADRSGLCRLTAAGGGPLFAVVGGKVRLWEGGDETYLRACGFVQGRSAPPSEEADARRNAPDALAKAEAPIKEQAEPTADGEPAYTLRPAGTGENVDALPEYRRSNAAKP